RSPSGGLSGLQALPAAGLQRPAAGMAASAARRHRRQSESPLAGFRFADARDRTCSGAAVFPPAIPHDLSGILQETTHGTGAPRTTARRKARSRGSGQRLRIAQRISRGVRPHIGGPPGRRSDNRTIITAQIPSPIGPLAVGATEE